MDEPSLTDRVRRLEHTGERRCWPCTVVNAVLLALGTLLLRRSRLRALSLPLALFGTAAIWLRGYLVPGTPRWAPKLVAALPLPYDPFDHGGRYAPDPSADSPGRAGVAGGGTGSGTVETDGAAGTDGTAEDDGATEDDPTPGSSDSLGEDVPPEELLSRLAETGLVHEDGEDLVLDAGFEADWHDAMDDLADLSTGELAAATFEIAHAADYETYADEYGEWVLLDDGRGGVKGRTWLTRPVAIAEAGAVRALEGRIEDRGTRLAAAGPLRMFLQSCPDCGSDLGFTTSQACCGGGTDPRSEPDDVLACPACDVRLYTFPR
jgi:hypothetical protein